jgi:hypothetical protein
MRRILRKIAHREEDSLGDVSTLADPSVVPVGSRADVALVQCHGLYPVEANC